MCFGLPPFQSKPDANGWAGKYEPCDKRSGLFHHLNRVTVREGDRERTLLIVKLTHPAARDNKYRAACVVSHPEFRRVAGLPD